MPTNDKLPPVAHYIAGSDILEGSTLHDGEDGTTTSSKVNDLTGLTQIKYNHNKDLLAELINSASNIVLFLNEKLDAIHYPKKYLNSRNEKLMTNTSKLAFERTNRSIDDNINNEIIANNIAANEFVNPFTILTLDISLGHQSTDIHDTLDANAISSLLSNKFTHVLRHLNSLLDRINDTNSMVLVTGDLNSGKSSFCNHLLKRKILPVDQQPCTNVFCEIIPYDENHLIEEVHAVLIGSDYNADDASTFKKFKLDDLYELVHQNDIFSILKIYLNDNRSKNESLLKNGIVDIRLIDSPGLNLDSFQTMQLFSRQEEIDLVIFVVNAENHFTLSGREFISNVNNDKKYSFIVVNKFDNIKNKQKCKDKILEQVEGLTPEILKDNENDFVHFVSSKGYDDDSDDDSNGGDDDDDDDDGDGDDENDANDPAFDHLEKSLRNLVLEKRSITKLQPAKTYLVKLLTDLKQLIDINENHYLELFNQYDSELKLITPKYEEAVKNSIVINEKIMKLIDDCTNDIYNRTRQTILNTIDELSLKEIDSSNISFFAMDKFIQSEKLLLISKIIESVDSAENYARIQTVDYVEKIRMVGLEFLADVPQMKFKSEIMYSHKKDKQLKNGLHVNFQVLDLLETDFNSVRSIFTTLTKLINLDSIKSYVKTFSIKNISFSNTNNLLLLAPLLTITPKLLTLTSSVQAFSSLPPIIHYATGISLICIPVYHLIQTAPSRIHSTLLKSLRKEINESDYLHAHSLRISKEVRKVLNYPGRDVTVGISSLVDRESNKRLEIGKKKKKVKNIVELLTGLNSDVAGCLQSVYEVEVDID